MSADETEVGASADQGEASVENEVSSGPWLKTLGTGLGGITTSIYIYSTDDRSIGLLITYTETIAYMCN